MAHAFRIPGASTPTLTDEFEPRCRAIAADVVDGGPRGDTTNIMLAVAEIFALRVPNAFLGWPTTLEGPRRLWTAKNRAATLARDRPATTAIAVEFNGFIRELLTMRRRAGEAASNDLTTCLLRERRDSTDACAPYCPPSRDHASCRSRRPTHRR